MGPHARFAFFDPPARLLAGLDRHGQFSCSRTGPVAPARSLCVTSGKVTPTSKVPQAACTTRTGIRRRQLDNRLDHVLQRIHVVVVQKHAFERRQVLSTGPLRRNGRSAPPHDRPSSTGSPAPLPAVRLFTGSAVQESSTGFQPAPYPSRHAQLYQLAHRESLYLCRLVDKTLHRPCTRRLFPNANDRRTLLPITHRSELHRPFVTQSIERLARAPVTISGRINPLDAAPLSPLRSRRGSANARLCRGKHHPGPPLLPPRPPIARPNTNAIPAQPPRPRKARPFPFAGLPCTDADHPTDQPPERRSNRPSDRTRSGCRQHRRLTHRPLRLG